MQTQPAALWADKPYPLLPALGTRETLENAHGAEYLAQHMVHLHNCIIRTMNAIYNQAQHVKTADDIELLLTLTRLWCMEVEHHHMTEEEFIFPRLEAITGVKDISAVDIEQHHAFLPGLATLMRYARETGAETYRSEDLLAIFDQLSGAFMTHLVDEIEHLRSLKSYNSQALRHLVQESQDWVSKNCQPEIQFPLIMGSFDVTYQASDTAISIPWYGRLAVKYWYGRKYAGAWKMMPCTFDGRPRPLYAASL